MLVQTKQKIAPTQPAYITNHMSRTHYHVKVSCVNFTYVKLTHVKVKTYYHEHHFCMSKC